MNWLIFPLVAAGFIFGGVYHYTTVAALLIIQPTIDYFLRSEKKTPFIAANLNLWLHSVVQVLLVAWATWYASQTQLETYEFVGLILSVGFCSAVGFTAAHELIHRRERWERGLGLLLLASTSYMHFRVEHVFGHHKHVATPTDPASARKNEGIYAFWVRCIFYSFISAWKIESRRCGGKFFALKNRMLHYLIVQPIIIFGIYFGLGETALIFFLGQALVAILLLETINYVEHYGLVRKKNASGEYEAYSAKHSWDSDNVLTNRMLFNLGKHAHHHQSPTKHYEDLEIFADAPRLPAGYVSMVILAFVPPLWKRVMNNR